MGPDDTRVIMCRIIAFTTIHLHTSVITVVVWKSVAIYFFLVILAAASAYTQLPPNLQYI